MYIEEWQWDDGNLDHLHEHGLDDRIVVQVWLDSPRSRSNPHGPPDSRQMVGFDDSGQMWVICARPVIGEPGVWRAVTGWPAEPEDQEWYRRSR